MQQHENPSNTSEKNRALYHWRAQLAADRIILFMNTYDNVQIRERASYQMLVNTLKVKRQHSS
jgi:hypothetical protein